MALVMITGGAGYIGSHAVLAFRDAGYRVVVVDDLSTGVRENLPLEVELIVGDAGDRDLLDAVIPTHRPEAVLHFAAAIQVPESMADPHKYYRNNTVASLALIDACTRHGVPRFLFSSTAAVYGMPDGGVASESQPTLPINPYGWSKLMIERILADMSRAHGLQYAVMRYFNVAGADPAGRTGQSTPQATHLVKVACEVATGQRPRLEIFGDDYDTRDGSCIRDFIHVSDLADAHLAVFQYIRESTGCPVFNCGNGRGYSVWETVRALERVVGRPIATKVAPRRAGDPPTLIADPSRLRDSLDWRPRYGMEDILDTALHWESRLARSRSLARPA